MSRCLYAENGGTATSRDVCEDAPGTAREVLSPFWGAGLSGVVPISRSKLLRWLLYGRVRKNEQVAKPTKLSEIINNIVKRVNRNR